MTENKEVEEEKEGTEEEKNLIAKIEELGRTAMSKIKAFNELPKKIEDFLKRMEDPTLKDPDVEEALVLTKQIRMSSDNGRKEMHEIYEIAGTTVNRNVLLVAGKVMADYVAVAIH